MDIIENNNGLGEYEKIISPVRKQQLEMAFHELVLFIKNAFSEGYLHSAWRVYYVPGDKYEKKVKQNHVRIKLLVNITTCPDDEVLPIEYLPHNDCDEEDYVFDLKNVTGEEKIVFMKMLISFCNKNNVYFYNSIFKRKYWTTVVFENPTLESIAETEKRELQLSTMNDSYMVRLTTFHDDCISAKLIRFVK